jgi:hypothetical protein
MTLVRAEVVRNTRNVAKIKQRCDSYLKKQSNKNCNDFLGAKNNDSLAKKQAIVKFYTMEYRKCGKFNSKNDSRPCMGGKGQTTRLSLNLFLVHT